MTIFHGRLERLPCILATIMALSSFILEQALRQLGLPERSLRQFAIASDLSNVDGRGFPRELFQISAPLIVRGLLNFAVLQMRRNWLYPAWVHRQLDPDDVAYVARAQNPIFVNSTHRNWTLLGSPHGRHEAIVDRHGLATPLPREWSLDVWLLTDDGMYVPSRAVAPYQTLDTAAPVLRTEHEAFDFAVTQEHFVGSTNHLLDVLFQKISVTNRSPDRRRSTLAVSVRPFNPEGVAPIERMALHGSRFIMVDGLLGLVLAQEPDSVLFSSGDRGDLAEWLSRGHAPGARLRNDPGFQFSSTCSSGLAHGTVLYDIALDPGETWTTHASVALGTDRTLRSMSARHTWRVSYEQRMQRHRRAWVAEIERGVHVELPDPKLQALFDANRNTLLQLHDKDVITPGPFLYHHMWYRDAATMCRALDVMGFHDRVRSVINGFKRGQTSVGFFRGPDGEWDSNGAVLHLVWRHIELTRAQLWLRSIFPSLQAAGKWIVAQRRRSHRTTSTHPGLMPPGLSAEHLGTVDQYYWDSLHSVAGLRSLRSIANELGRSESADTWDREAIAFQHDLRTSLQEVHTRSGTSLIPATPVRDFDESAIGSVAGVYPLGIDDIDPTAFLDTVEELSKRFVREGGFLHPFIHSGFNPYLTMQIAHAELWRGNIERAWEIAQTILRQAGDPYSLPEAIHPRTGGGVMGDGHHGWAAAEIILFLRDCLVDDRGGSLVLLKGAGPIFRGQEVALRLERIPTTFGRISLVLAKSLEGPLRFTFTPDFFTGLHPTSVTLHVPWKLRRVLPSSPSHLIGIDHTSTGTVIRFSAEIRSAIFEL